MNLTILQTRPLDAQSWARACHDIQQLISASPCLTCGPGLGEVFLDSAPATGDLGLHIDSWQAPGHPLMFWPSESLPHTRRVALPPGVPGSNARAYAELFLALTLRTAHLTAGALEIDLGADLTSVASAARRTVAAHFADQCAVKTGTLGPQ